MIIFLFLLNILILNLQDSKWYFILQRWRSRRAAQKHFFLLLLLQNTTISQSSPTKQPISIKHPKNNQQVTIMISPTISQIFVTK